MPKRTNVNSTVITSSTTNVVIRNLYGHGNGTIQIRCDNDNICSDVVNKINENCKSEVVDAKECQNATLAYPPPSDCAEFCVDGWIYNTENPGNSFDGGSYCTSVNVAQSNCQNSTDEVLSNCAADQINQYCYPLPERQWGGLVLPAFAIIAACVGIFACVKKCREKPARNDANDLHVPLTQNRV